MKRWNNDRSGSMFHLGWKSKYQFPGYQIDRLQNLRNQGISSSSIVSSPASLLSLSSRPSLDDVERLSKGQAATRKGKGKGSRKVCHRLNEMERKEFDLAKQRGYLQLRGTGYRKERKGSPLANIHRQLADAKIKPCIQIQRGSGVNAYDIIAIDVSTLRSKAYFKALVSFLLEIYIKNKENLENEKENEKITENIEEYKATLINKWEVLHEYTEEEKWDTNPIWDLPLLTFEYKCTDRKIGKEIAAEIANIFENINFDQDDISAEVELTHLKKKEDEKEEDRKKEEEPAREMPVGQDEENELQSQKEEKKKSKLAIDI